MSKPKKYEQYHTEEEPVQCTQKGFEHRYICQGCLEEEHVQLPADEAYDCKMVFVRRNKEGKLDSCGQCCCYSLAHGKRDRNDG